MTTSATPLTLPSLLSDLHHLSSKPSLLPSLDPDTAHSSPPSQDPSALAVSVADSFLLDSQRVLHKLDSEQVQELGQAIERLEKRVESIGRALR
ncbi:BZ3500_MvSof-1268-A1-R1_Chr12-2g03862 [Microbotryum saponariae]|uniref:BZ3500_MvSof-1268-A1-R1_Chr12-2g03862 protein n=1 Tax=Microbotryum saponariae TaxID=289078 RepID=A0A2X0MYW9_9BASI|nr:BZ3500_MvSof-1268-A1-R1_Chr12-2g03862 [Microbotryum saponariae]SCZ99832.1 BZ3501_MvSof-1269-A2-R1_Chr12-2g03518 [Microbotryum saponariae]